MKKFWGLLCSLLFILTVSGCKEKEDIIVPLPSIDTTEKETENVGISKDSVRILAIGNSFSDNAMSHLYSILKAFGANEIILGNMYIGGCSMNKHYNNAINDKPDYTYRKNDSREATAGTFVNTTETKLSTAIPDEDWQFVTMQQASGSAGKIETYIPNEINSLVDYTKNLLTNKDAKFYWHMTWAYQSDSTHSEFVKYNNDQKTMYEAICATVQESILPNSNFAGIIPSGTAIQNARTSYFQDKLTADGYHLNSLGEYIIGLTWVLKITGWDIKDLNLDYVPNQFKMDIENIKEAAVNAVKTPFEVTESTHKDEPNIEIDLSKYNQLDLNLELGFWNAQMGIDLVKTSGISNQFASTSKRFTKEELPNGSLILLSNSDYKYRPEGWIKKDESTSINRAPIETSKLIVIDDAWWGNYEVRAFNIFKSKKVDMTELINEAKDAFKIYVPKN